jgi:hypothetical protein
VVFVSLGIVPTVVFVSHFRSNDTNHI